MEFYIFNITVLLFLWQFNGLFARHHHNEEHKRPYDDNSDEHQDDTNELSDHCIYFRIDHDTRQTDTMFCPYGCCGDLDDQKCCEKPEEEDDDRGNSRLVHGLLGFAGVMLVIALTCCVFGIYKHKKAKLRKTSPGRHYQTTEHVARPAPYAIFYTPRSGSGLAPPSKDSKNLPDHSNQSDRIRPATIKTPPPRYTENADPEPDLPPYSSSSPPPPYSFNVGAMPPSSTQFHSSD